MSASIPTAVTRSESPAHRWRARQLRRAAVLVCVPGLAMGTVTLVGAYSFGAFDHPEPLGGETVALVAVPTRSSFGLQVLNGSGRSGLATTAARSFTSQGFHVTTVGNAPERLWHDHPAVIWFGPDGAGAARLVAAQIPGSRLVEDVRTGTGVQVVLGTAFQTPTAP